MSVAAYKLQHKVEGSIHSHGIGGRSRLLSYHQSAISPEVEHLELVGLALSAIEVCPDQWQHQAAPEATASTAPEGAAGLHACWAEHI